MVLVGKQGHSSVIIVYHCVVPAVRQTIQYSVKLDSLFYQLNEQAIYDHA